MRKTFMESAGVTFAKTLLIVVAVILLARGGFELINTIKCQIIECVPAEVVIDRQKKEIERLEKLIEDEKKLREEAEKAKKEAEESLKELEEKKGTLDEASKNGKSRVSDLFKVNKAKAVKKPTPVDQIVLTSSSVPEIGNGKKPDMEVVSQVIIEELWNIYCIDSKTTCEG